ncbi:MAG TPA: alkaline phosphatase, partial [Thermoanaerobaculia bacterium]|nr:alkaline phosphatase [Thermoanaerobaculia bacterium]
MKPQPCLLIAAALLSACTATAPDTADLQAALSDDWPRPRAEDALFLGAGDIARCGRQLADARATGDLIRGFLGSFEEARVFTAGDNAYEEGTAAQFADCYEPTWGSFNDRTLPSPGNHDYRILPPPYFDYFVHYRNHPAAKTRGYYSFDLKDWHIVSLNSNIAMDAASPQVQWLESDLCA